jgi:hypothetical protein
MLVVGRTVVHLRVVDPPVGFARGQQSSVGGTLFYGVERESACQRPEF